MIALYIISLISFSIGTILFIVFLFSKNNYKFKLKPKNNINYAILIPAKDESKVISGLLKSIEKQVDSMKDTYIIVESKKDKTCEIAKEMGAKIILRKDLSKKRKGYALDEAIKEILKEKSYDLYFIFDADNILEIDFIEKMLKTYQLGYDIGVGYRNIKNGDNIIAATSGITFCMLNMFNKVKNKLKQVIAISGTGFYISGEIINKLKGFPFNSLTEDYELSLYASANNLSTFYNDEAVFYDEQPTNLITSIKQRTRWVKGFFEARDKRLKDIKNDNTRKFGITPYIFIIAGLLLFIFTNIFATIYYIIIRNDLFITTLLYTLFSILLIYIVLGGATIYILIHDAKINLSKTTKFKTVIFNPIFLTTYVICFFQAILKKDVKWEKIEHKEILKKY